MCEITMEIQETEGSSGNTGNLPFTNQHICISRAPPPLRFVDQRSFDPLVVSIGPYHREKQAQLAIKHKDKLQFVYDFLACLGQKMQPQQAMGELLGEMNQLESRARECYSEDFDGISQSDFAEMLAVDGCFIIGLLHGENMAFSPSNPIFMARWIVPSIRLDSVKVENQLPYFVLQKLHESFVRLAGKPLSPLSQLATKFFAPLVPGAKEPRHNANAEFKHLLELFHLVLHPESSGWTVPNAVHLDGKSKGHPITRACRLWSRGILLNRKDNSSMEITLQNGFLRVPCLTIDQNTQTILRNLVAYEQSNRLVKSSATAYVLFMDGLVDTSDDVAFLRHKGIISHSLGSDEEATSLINNLPKGITHNEYECFLCQLDDKIKPSIFRLIRVGMSFSEFFVFAILHPSSFITLFVGTLALYVGITQTILAVFSLR